MIDDSGLGRPRTIEERIAELERQVAIIFKHCPKTPNITEVTARAKRKARRDD